MLDKKQIANIKKDINESRVAEDERLPIIFSALGDRGRFRIFRLLTERCDVCVTDVANIFSMSVPAASQQLRVLEMIGLVRKERVGQTICYEVKSDDWLVKLLMKFFSSKSQLSKISELRQVSFDREKVSA